MRRVSFAHARCKNIGVVKIEKDRARGWILVRSLKTLVSCCSLHQVSNDMV